ncbi:MAG: helix-turn-helix domain-containing protein [Acidobacteria bacterium]|nr:helix-turn-helix domain-containing protein [Acidobacteriota bacterium]
MHWYPRYLSIGARRARALPEMLRLRERGVHVQPIETTGQTVARRFWGRRWFDHLDSFAGREDRLALGRALVRRGAVCHLEIRPGVVEAMVAGSALYRVVVRMRTTEPTAWQAVVRACAGRVGSIPDLLRGALPNGAIEAVTDPDRGLLPRREEIDPHCGCADGTALCRHAAAALYGVGLRLDAAPELLFRLRGVDETDLIAAGPAPAGAPPAGAAAGRPPADPVPADLAPADPVPADPVPADPVPANPASEDSAPPGSAPPDSAAARPDHGPAVNRDEAGFRPTGDLIRQLRRTSGFSVAEFAELLRVSAATVRRWEAVSGALTLRSGPRDALQTLHDEIEGVGTC